MIALLFIAGPFFVVCVGACSSGTSNKTASASSSSGVVKLSSSSSVVVVFFTGTFNTLAIGAFNALPINSFLTPVARIAFSALAKSSPGKILNYWLWRE